MSHLPEPLNSQHDNLSQKRLLKRLIGASGAISITKPSRARRLFGWVAGGISRYRSIWKLAWNEFGRTRGAFWVMRGMTWLAMALFTIGGASVYGIAKFFFPFLPISWWLVTSVVSFALGQVFVIHWSTKAHERMGSERVDELEERIWALGNLLQPELFIDYRPEEGEPFVHREEGLTQYRVSVRSPVSVPDVELVVNNLRVTGSPALFDHHLRPMNDRDEKSGTKRIILKARREKHWDLVCFHKAVSEDRNLVLVTFIPALGGVELLPGEYQFELMATGGERPDATKIVNMIIAEDRTIESLRVQDGRLSPRLS